MMEEFKVKTNKTLHDYLTCIRFRILKTKRENIKYFVVI